MKLKVFLSKYDILLFAILFFVGAALFEFSKSFWPWIFCTLIGFIIIMSVAPPAEYKWACKKCGYQADKREKYCTKCGSIMESKRIIQYKICENDHEMLFDEHDLYKFCPRCGKPLKEQIIPEMGEELNEEK